MGSREGPLEYVGFWLRLGASVIDSLLALLITMPLLGMVFGRVTDLTPADFRAHPEAALVQWVLPTVLVIGFWIARQATPGKMLISARIVDARTGARPSIGQSLLRLLVVTATLGIGFLWVGLDARRQSWHDKAARTVVVRPGSGHGPIAHFTGR